MTFKAINPATGETLAEFPAATLDEIEDTLERVHDRFHTWKNQGFEHRAGCFRRMASALRAKKEDLATLMTQEMGKPISEGRGEVEKCAWVCEYYADEAEGFLAPQHLESDASRSGIRYDPLGVVLAIMPWNFPLWQVFRFAAPTLMAGNTAILKHASNVPGCAQAIEDLFVDAGFDADVFRNLYLSHDDVPGVIEDNRIAAVTLTGSLRAGQAVGEAAGRAIKPFVLELGGSDPFVVFENASISDAVAAGVTSRTINSGQSCIAAKRFIVVESVYDEFRTQFLAAMDALRVADPTLDHADIGPMARVDLAHGLWDQVQRSVSAGATVALGGSAPEQGSAWFAPTVLENVTPGMAAFDEEMFGPVAALIKAKDREHAIKLANQSEFGLGASVWTQDDEVDPLIRRLEAGCVFVNGFVKSDPRLPFGGIKTSGVGRELSHLGIWEFVNQKTFWVA